MHFVWCLWPPKLYHFWSATWLFLFFLCYLLFCLQLTCPFQSNKLLFHIISYICTKILSYWISYTNANYKSISHPSSTPKAHPSITHHLEFMITLLLFPTLLNLSSRLSTCLSIHLSLCLLKILSALILHNNEALYFLYT